MFAKEKQFPKERTGYGRKNNLRNKKTVCEIEKEQLTKERKTIERKF